MRREALRMPARLSSIAAVQVLEGGPAPFRRDAAGAYWDKRRLLISLAMSRNAARS
jgi:hypothetical protein